MSIPDELADLDALECRIRLIQARAESQVLGILVKHQGSTTSVSTSQSRENEINKIWSQSEFGAYECGDYSPWNESVSRPLMPAFSEEFSINILKPNFTDESSTSIRRSNFWDNSSISIPRPNFSVEKGLERKSKEYKLPIEFSRTSWDDNTAIKNTNSESGQSVDFKNEITLIRQANRELKEKLATVHAVLIDLKEGMTVAVWKQLTSLTSRVEALQKEKANFLNINNKIKSKIEQMYQEVNLAREKVVGLDATIHNLKCSHGTIIVQQREKAQIIYTLDAQLQQYENESRKLEKFLNAHRAAQNSQMAHDKLAEPPKIPTPTRDTINQNGQQIIPNADGTIDAFMTVPRGLNLDQLMQMVLNSLSAKEATSPNDSKGDQMKMKDVAETTTTTVM